MRCILSIFALTVMLHKFETAQCFVPSHSFHNSCNKAGNGPWSLPNESKVHVRRPSTFIIMDKSDEDDHEDDDEEEEFDLEDPYIKVAGSEFEDEKVGVGALSTLSGSAVDWGGELGKLRQRVEDVDSGRSQDPSTALFRLMSSETPNELIGKFVSNASPMVVKACSDAVNALLGGLSSPTMGVETIVKTNGEKIGSLCFQLQMTGYMFRNAEYVLALKAMMDIRGLATLQDYKDAFDRCDSDKSGFIERSEVKRLLDEVYKSSAPSFEVDAFLAFFDTNKDGKISWAEFETGLGAVMANQTLPKTLPKTVHSLPFPESIDDEDEEAVLVEPEISGVVEIVLENGEIISVEAKDYIRSLKSEAEALKEALQQEKMWPTPAKNGIVGVSPQRSEDFGGIAQYMASREGDIKALTEGIQPEIVTAMKMLVDFVLQGGGSRVGKNVPKAELEMELPGSALQQLALWQLVLGYRLREAEATGEYLKLLE